MSGGEPDWGQLARREIAWHDPLPTAVVGRELDGLSFLRRIIDGELPTPPICETLGFRLVAADEDEVTVVGHPDPSFYSPIGMVHGGWLCTLLDSACGLSVHTRLPAGTSHASIEIKVNYLRPITADGGPITVKGRALQVGRRVAVAEAQARDGSDRLVGHATSSLALLAG